jgi:DNA-directed RNA polymerase subunit RPC12/RpoP
MGCRPTEIAVRCEGCGTDMVAESTEERDSDEKKWTCPRCGSWCLTDSGEVYMAAWLLEGREWPA